MRIGGTSSIVVVLAVLLVVLSVSAPAFASEVIDQKQEIFSGGVSIKNNPIVGQEFVPSLPNLIAVEVHIYFADNVPTSQLTLSIREGTIDGTVVSGSTQSKDVSGNVDDNFWLRFDFPVPLSVTPLSTYVIRLEANDPSGLLSWNYAVTDLYSSGRAIINSIPSSGSDFTFRTYAQVSESPSGPSGYVGGELFSANKLAVLSPYLALFSVIAVAAVLVKRKTM